MNEYGFVTVPAAVKVADEEAARRLAERQREAREAMGDKWLCHAPSERLPEPERG